MHKFKWQQRTKRFILVLVSLLTLVSILITGAIGYAFTPDGAEVVKIMGTGLTIGDGDSRDRKPASERQQLEKPNQILYVPGNGSWANLDFFQAAPKEHLGLLVQAGPYPTPSEWSFPCSGTGGRFKIAWKKGSDRGCEPEGVKMQSSNKRSSLPNIQNNLQASRRLLAQAQDQVTVVPTPGESVIQTADTAAGITIDVLIGEVRVKSAKNPGGRLVKAGEKYAYPQDTITPIDQNSILNSPEMQEFLNPNNWLYPDIPERLAGAIINQLRDHRLAFSQSESTNVVGKCDEQTHSGGSEVSIIPFKLNVTKGAIKIAYNMYGVPDKLEVFYEGGVIWSTEQVPGNQGGYVRNNNEASISFQGNSNELTVKVTGNTQSTQWNYTLYCPS
jgi:hypothetical protein